MRGSAAAQMRPVLAHSIPAAAAHGASAVERVAYLDGWRGLAILFVLQSHFLTLHFIESGRLGVDVFFCLSGFLMSRILFVQRMPLALFYKRRISRIFPVFALFVTLVFGVAWWKAQPHAIGEFLATLLFLRTYVPAEPDIWHTGLPIGHLWSLNVEEHCYVLLSGLTLVAILRGREYLALLALGMLAIAIHLFYIRHPGFAPDSFEIRTEAAASHLLVSAGYFHLRQHVHAVVRPWMPVAAFALALCCYLYLAPWWASIVVSPLLLAFAVNHLDRLPASLLSILSAAPLRQFGLCSYSLYLWQQPFYEFRQWLPPGVPLILALAAGIASFYVFENPVRSWLNRHW
jgi:peptidoglycan/LPS O-acetylase OafA/YrhL